MASSQKPSPPEERPTQSEPTDAFAHSVGRALAKALRETGGAGPPSPPPDPAKAVHNEVTKLKATTLNSIALAFLIGGGVAPLVSWATTGVSPLQAALGAVWLITGILLHYGARRILRALVS